MFFYFDVSFLLCQLGSKHSVMSFLISPTLNNFWVLFSSISKMVFGGNSSLVSVYLWVCLSPLIILLNLAPCYTGSKKYKKHSLLSIKEIIFLITLEVCYFTPLFLSPEASDSPFRITCLNILEVVKFARLLPAFSNVLFHFSICFLLFNW